MKCISCKKNLDSEEGFTKFMCPNCSGPEILRCVDCRRRGNVYKCPSCGFEGP